MSKSSRWLWMTYHYRIGKTCYYDNDTALLSSFIECHSILSQRKLLHKTQNTVHDNHFSHHRCNKYVTYHLSWSIPSAWDYATCHFYIGWDHLHPIWNPIFLALLKCERAPSTLRYTIEGLRWSYSKTHVNNVLSFGRFQKRLLGVVFGFGTCEIQWKREREGFFCFASISPRFVGDCIMRVLPYVTWNVRVCANFKHRKLDLVHIVISFWA